MKTMSIRESGGFKDGTGQYGNKERDLKWMWYYEHARKYYQIHGALNIPCSYVDGDGCRLGQWMARQRKAYRLKRSGKERGKHQPMITDREEKLLEELGIQWDLTWQGKHVSVPEIIVFYYVSRFFPDAVKLSAGDFLGREIDIYIPSIRLGIEYDGVVWHRDKSERDEEKGILCKKAGIRLIRIREKGLCAIQNCDENYFVEVHDQKDLQRTVETILSELTQQKAECCIGKDFSDIISAYRNYSSHKWDMIYERLAARYQKEQAVEIHPGDMDESGINLYYWLCCQRKEYQQGRMSEEHQMKLQNLGISLDPGQDAWEAGISSLREYSRTFGNVNVEIGYTAPDGMALGKWVSHRRGEYRRGTLDENRRKILEDLGIVWSPMKNDEKMKRELLDAYFKEYGTIHMPMHTVYGGITLWEWLEGKKKKYRKGKLNREEIDFFNQYGMIWNSSEEIWERNYQAAKDYYEQNGSLFLPVNFRSETGVNLWNWISGQRSRYRNGQLSREQIRRLESIGMIWEPYEFKWKKNYHILKKYYENYGTVDVPCDFVYDGVKLGMWLSTQRQAYRGNPNYHITPERIALLNELGMDWKEQGNRRGAERSEEGKQNE